LVERQRLSFKIPFADWVQAAAHPRTVQLLPVTAAIAAEVAALPKTFHRDPADRVIVATSRVMQLAVLTRDQRITRSRLAQRWVP
jgi:PIN domain nuclease of toxin-antitoxin system